MRALLTQHHDDGRDPRTEEDVRRQSDDGINVVFLDEILPYRPLLTTAKENAMRQDNRHDAVGSQMVQIVQEKRIVRLATRRKSEAHITRVMLLVGRIPCL